MARDKRQFAQIDVGWYMNPKWFQVERALRLAMPNAMPDALLHALQDAKQLHLTSILYSAQARWDGMFPVEAVKNFARITHEEAVTALFEVGMWINHPGGMAETRDYLKHQTSSSELEAASEKAKKAAEKRWGNASSNASSNAKRMPESDALSNAEKRREEKSTLEVPKGTSSRKRPSTRIPENWQPNESHHTKARELRVNLNLEAQKFINHAQANDRKQVDWNKSFHGWLLKASEYASRTQSRGGFVVDRQGELLKREAERINAQYGQQPRLEIGQ